MPLPDITPNEARFAALDPSAARPAAPSLPGWSSPLLPKCLTRTPASALCTGLLRVRAKGRAPLVGPTGDSVPKTSRKVPESLQHNRLSMCRPVTQGVSLLEFAGGFKRNLGNQKAHPCVSGTSCPFFEAPSTKSYRCSCLARRTCLNLPKSGYICHKQRGPRFQISGATTKKPKKRGEPMEP